MRLTPLLAGFTLAGLLLSGTTQAAAGSYPIRDRVLTANALYRGAELQPDDCAERMDGSGAAAAKRYLTAMLDCLNTTWAAHFKRVGLPFAKARIGFITKPRRYCGGPWGDAAAAYCSKERRFLVLLDRDVLGVPSDLYLLNLAAHEYGHHVQHLTGIERAFDRYPYKGKSELNEQFRRLELQADCLSGAFMKSAWDAVGGTADDWEVLLDMNRASGDEHAKVRDHGKGRNVAAWADKGFDAASPRVCNTWTAPSAKVA